MPPRLNYAPRINEAETTPFQSAEEAWFWFVQNQLAKADGARISAGVSSVARPCEPVDIYKIMERLYRGRRLSMDHILVLRHYGRRLMPPDLRRLKEIRAHGLWTEALELMEDSMILKGIVAAKPVFSWAAAMEQCGEECYA